MGSSSENDLRSHMMLPKMGMVRGPGGSFLVLDFEMMKKKFSLSSFSPLKNSSFVFFDYLFVNFDVIGINLFSNMHTCPINIRHEDQRQATSKLIGECIKPNVVVLL
ncbi:hypothetical protein F8388_021145 [Cannabis sativa]|uniref:Uncharacterized protein n=1 Tax=Cannabis sativa TaxID=3483 RepID=A0A7J6GZN7_CANSA|nr:hypothetical protein G4B88_021480 [Cannabis sativa]KAF4388315.1 hypothetical protein F8388_021145 [Cannabis sativa]